MFKILTLDKISAQGLELFPRENYEVASEIRHPDAVLVRSFKMHDMELPPSLLAIARAGAGVNNIPIDKCTAKGVVVFNTPGANANAVKELVITGLFLSSRSVVDGIIWAKSLIGRGDEVPQIVEKEKSRFTGPEIKGKTLGVIGLGAIGVMVANAALALGMHVVGFDPFISIENAWGLSSRVKHAKRLESLLAESDYISIHVPLTEETKGMINQNRISYMRKGVRLLNFARGGLVNNEDLKEALAKQQVAAYVTDFPDEELLKMKNVISIPHLGASTPEAEENCAIFAVRQLIDYLESGNIKNSVNFPECSMSLLSKARIIIANKNVPNMVGQITTVLAKSNINISNMINQHKNDVAYNIIDVDEIVSSEILTDLRKIDGVIMARTIVNER